MNHGYNLKFLIYNFHKTWFTPHFVCFIHNPHDQPSHRATRHVKLCFGFLGKGKDFEKDVGPKTTIMKPWIIESTANQPDLSLSRPRLIR